MSTVRNGQLIFNEVPTGFPEPGKTTVYRDTATIDLDSVPLDGGVLFKTLYLSIDPFLRGRMRSPEVKSYAPAYVLGQPVQGYAVGRILRSEHKAFKEGDHIVTFTNFQEYNVIPASSNLDAISVLPEVKGKNGDLLPWSLYVGVLGMPGRTAYGGWKEYANAKKGETVFVSTAAGPVGSFLIQLAKRDGLKVIASAGSKEKVDFCKSIGADVAFNYKTESTKDILEKNGPIDIYWDNVGGETLDIAFANASLHARFVECGMISQYNNKDGYNFKNFGRVISQRIRLTGLLVYDTDPIHEESFYKEIPALVANGELKYSEDVTKGLELAGHAILDVQLGRNKAKSVVWVADD